MTIEIIIIIFFILFIAWAAYDCYIRSKETQVFVITNSKSGRVKAIAIPKNNRSASEGVKGDVRNIYDVVLPLDITNNELIHILEVLYDFNKDTKNEV